MMKLWYCFVLFGIGLLFGPQSQGQDLIERAQLDVTLNSSRMQPSVAFIESQSLKHAGTYQEVSPFELAPENRKSEVSEYVDGHVMLEIPAGTLPRLVSSMGDAIDLRIPVADGKEIELDLVEVFPLSSGFEIETSEGETFYLEDMPVRFYRGAIKDVPNSFASISIADGMFRGLIGDDYGNYVLAEIENSTDRFVLYNDQKLKMEHRFQCGQDYDVPYDDHQQELLRKTTRIEDHSRGDDCVEVYIEMEEDFYDDWNNLSSATNFAYDLFNEVATLYNNENISIALKKLKVWTTADPYTNSSLCTTASVDLLDEFADELQNSYDGRLAHLITSRSVGGGCAFVDVLCSTYTNSTSSSPHAVSGGMSNSVTAFPTYSWNVMVFAHEMGHNFGSRHTHACVWNGNNTAIDGCGPNNGFPTEGGCATPPVPAGGGTIMSYCHLDPVGINFNLGFGTQPGNLIRNEVATGSCTLDCSNSGDCPQFIYLDGNIDSDTYYADDRIEVGGTVTSTSSVNCYAEQEVELKDGFRVNNGGTFLAGYATCTAALNGGNSTQTIEGETAPETISSETNTTNK